ncbi:MAG: hypothetical protein Q9217_006566 [Psora testacea]
MAVTTVRASPVKHTSLFRRYIPNTYAHPDREGAIPLDGKFRVIRPGPGSRHIYDKAPFCLWDEQQKVYHQPTKDEVDWMMKEFKATNIDVALPFIVIATSVPPLLLPLTVAACPVRFIPSEMSLHPRPIGAFRPWADPKTELLGYPLQPWSFPTKAQRLEIIESLGARLGAEMLLAAVHFSPPCIIAELIKGTAAPSKRSLPGTAGGLLIMYYDSGKSSFRGSVVEKHFERLISPTASTIDDSDYLHVEPNVLSPGVCLSSAEFSSGHQHSGKFQSTTSGLLLQVGTDRRLTVANHGFPTEEVYHPKPPQSAGRRIGRITDRREGLDIALVELDPSIAFDNSRVFHNCTPQRLIPADRVVYGTWFECDGMSTGCIDLMASTLSHSRPLTLTGVPYQSWLVETGFSAYGMTNPRLMEGICGTPIIDDNGTVPGFFSWINAAGTEAYSADLDLIIQEGFAVV